MKNHFCNNSGKVKVFTTIKVHRARSFPCSINHPQVLQLPPTEQDTCPSPGFAMGNATARTQTAIRTVRIDASTTKLQFSNNKPKVSICQKFYHHNEAFWFNLKISKEPYTYLASKNRKRSSRREYYVLEK